MEQTHKLGQELKSEKGFTLVELAIVMIIIGLLIGGVLKGQELIENAKVTATIAQVKGFQAAVNSFRDTYGATAGDMRNATTRLSGCTAANFCANGNGDSLIQRLQATAAAGAAAAGAPAAAAANNPAWNVGGGAGALVEGTMFWKHVALADLVTGIDPTINPAVATSLAWGSSHPSSSLRGGYEFYYDTNTNDINGSTASGHVLRLSNGGLTAAIGAAAGTEPAAGQQAANIDRKLDDGRPGTGTVIAFGNNGAANTSCITAGAYNEQTDAKSCAVYFLIDG